MTQQPVLLDLCVYLILFKGETKERKGPRTSPGTQKEEEEMASKRPRLNRRDFKPFDYAGSKFTEFTKGQSVEVSISVLFPGLVYMGMRLCQHSHPPPVF